MSIKLFIGDSEEVVRYGLKAIIGELDPQGIDIVGEGSDGLKILDECVFKKADVYLMNIEMPGLNGLHAAAELQNKVPGCVTVIMSPWYDRQMLERAFMWGAKGFVLKHSTGEDIVRAIRETYKGNYYISSEISADILQPIVTKICNGSSKEDQFSTITQRQIEILKLICDGLTEKEIAEQLKISHHTVHVHTTNIMKALDLHTKADLIMYGIREGIVPLRTGVPNSGVPAKNSFRRGKVAQ
jgi:DNA-binding NarL/FixJ family response regulator